MKYKNSETNSARKWIKSLSTLLVILSFTSGCKLDIFGNVKVGIEDIEWCGDMGFIGAECDWTFKQARRSLEKSQWDKERLGMMCTNSDNVAHLTATILKLCGQSGACVKNDVQALLKLQEIANKTKGETVTPTISRSIKLGSSGNDVKELHRVLLLRGYSSADEGTDKFGAATDASVKDFQRESGLKADGVVGPKTWEKLNPGMHVEGSLYDDKGRTIIPFAIQHKRKMKTFGAYKNGYPSGAVVHFTAGQWETLENAFNVMDDGIENNYAYLNIAIGGELIQAHPVNMWGSHAGDSGWRGLVGKVSDDLIGIEMMNPGKLVVKRDGFYTYFGKKIEPEKHGLVRYVTEREYACPTGHYLAYSKEQEETLVNTIVWLSHNDPGNVFKVDNVVGHHEISGMLGLGYWRKNDPAGALSMPMADFRNFLRSKV